MQTLSEVLSGNHRDCCWLCRQEILMAVTWQIHRRRRYVLCRLPHATILCWTLPCYGECHKNCPQRGRALSALMRFVHTDEGLGSIVVRYLQENLWTLSHSRLERRLVHPFRFRESVQRLKLSLISSIPISASFASITCPSCNASVSPCLWRMTSTKRPGSLALPAAAKPMR